MKKKRLKDIGEIEKKFRLDFLTRCLNCELYFECKLDKDQLVLCPRFIELPDDEQVVIVRLKEWAHLKGNSLCNYIPQN